MLWVRELKMTKDILAPAAALVLMIILFLLIIKSNESQKSFKLNGRSKCMPNEYVKFDSFRKLQYYAYPGAVTFCEEKIGEILARTGRK
jgi:hypothetical protein